MDRSWRETSSAKIACLPERAPNRFHSRSFFSFLLKYLSMPTKKSLDDYYYDGLHDGRAGRPLDLPFSLDLIAGIWDDLGGRINSKRKRAS
jgi:hypothetical protein